MSAAGDCPYDWEIDPAGDWTEPYENRPGDHLGWALKIYDKLTVAAGAIHEAWDTVMDQASDVEEIGADVVQHQLWEVVSQLETLEDAVAGMVGNVLAGCDMARPLNGPG